MDKAIAALITSAVLVSSPTFAGEVASGSVQAPERYRLANRVYFVIEMDEAELQAKCLPPSMRGSRSAHAQACVDPLTNIRYKLNPCLPLGWPSDPLECHEHSHLLMPDGSPGWSGQHPQK